VSESSVSKDQAAKLEQLKSQGWTVTGPVNPSQIGGAAEVKSPDGKTFVVTPNGSLQEKA
jgi:hypothetical protein